MRIARSTTQIPPATLSAPKPGNSMAVCYLPDGSGVVTVGLDDTGSLLPLDA